MNIKTVQDMIIHAKELALLAAGIAHENRSRFSVSLKDDRSVVTEIDHLIQDKILESISSHFPEHAIIAEEEIAHPDKHSSFSDAEYCWVIDPLDGTRNYVSGLPCYATSIGMLHNGYPVGGVVYEHNVKQMFSAFTGGGTFCNDTRLTLCEPDKNRDRLVGISSSKSEFAVSVHHKWIAQRGLSLRNLGSAAFQLAMVSSGGLTAALCSKCKIWDIAAGAVLIREAGGIITSPEGDDPFPFYEDSDPFVNRPVLAAPAGFHKQLQESISDSVHMLEKIK